MSVWKQLRMIPYILLIWLLAGLAWGYLAVDQLFKWMVGRTR